MKTYPRDARALTTAAAGHADSDNDGIDRRAFLKCMGWVGTGIVWTVSGGILSSCTVGQQSVGGDFTFAQVSDSHIGFNKEPNADVAATLREAVNRVNALPTPPAFVLHTGDLSHLSKPEEFDTVDQSLRELKAKQVFYTPGEHDVFSDNGKAYLDRYGKASTTAVCISLPSSMCSTSKRAASVRSALTTRVAGKRRAR